MLDVQKCKMRSFRWDMMQMQIIKNETDSKAIYSGGCTGTQNSITITISPREFFVPPSHSKKNFPASTTHFIVDICAIYDYLLPLN